MSGGPPPGPAPRGRPYLTELLADVGEPSREERMRAVATADHLPSRIAGQLSRGEPDAGTGFRRGYPAGGTLGLGGCADRGLSRRAAALRTRARKGSPVDALLTAAGEPGGGTVLTGDLADLQALAGYASDVSIELL